MPAHVVGRVEDFSPGIVKVVRFGPDRLGVVSVDGVFYCFEDRCSHDDGPLGEGELRGCEIECPRHGARFDVRDGTVTKPPAVYPIETFPIEVVDGQVRLTLPD